MDVHQRCYMLRQSDVTASISVKRGCLNAKRSLQHTVVAKNEVRRGYVGNTLF